MLSLLSKWIEWKIQQIRMKLYYSLENIDFSYILFYVKQHDTPNGFLVLKVILVSHNEIVNFTN